MVLYHTYLHSWHCIIAYHDHIIHIRLRLVCAPCYSVHYLFILPSYQVSFHSTPLLPVFINVLGEIHAQLHVLHVIIHFEPAGENKLHHFSYIPKYQIQLHCLSYFIAIHKSPVYHGPLIMRKRG